MNKQLCLGTAQFGLAYGITNKSGRVSEKQVRNLLQIAQRAGILWLDTAQAYGTAEQVLGQNLPFNHQFQLVSKLPAQLKEEFSYKDILCWENQFQNSCRELGAIKLDAFLLHNPKDLAKPGGEYLREWLISLRHRGLTNRLGISIYDAEDLKDVGIDLLDLVQLPLSLLDQRLLQDGTIGYLRQNGVLIHARSLFMQGLILTQPDLWPSWAGAHVIRHQRALMKLAENKRCNLIDLALGFAKEQEDLNAIVIGICEETQLDELIQAWSRESPWEKDEWRKWSLEDSNILDPRKWPQ